MTTTTDYQKQGTDFCEAVGLKIEFRYTGHRARFVSGVPTACWAVTFTRDGRKPWTFDYSDSMNDSYQWQDQDTGRFNAPWTPLPQGMYGKVEVTTKRRPDDAMKDAATAYEVGKPTIWANYYVRRTAPPKTPTAYDVLTGITKSDPGAHSEFCAEYGYDPDSIKGKAIWEAVMEEWSNVRRMFSTVELEKLQEIA